MTDEIVKNIIDNAFDDNAAEMRNSLHDALRNKINDALETRKREIASSLISNNEEE